MSDQDKRQFERVSRNIALIYYFDDESSARRIEEATLTLEMSGGGLSMVVQNEIPAESHLKLKLLLAGQQMQCKGRVVRSESTDKGYVVGVELMLDDAARSALAQFLGLA